MSLYDLKCGEKGIIKNIVGDKKLSKRLFALGFIEGTEVKLKTAAPLGDPIIIHIRDFNIALRKKDAKNIFLKEA
ncbi:ferrous iron transport protein A [Clostridium neuense]|uniref:Ferrous iron transport protein A n=1 Tax=Clostridium neuense TaxID=1728934 RepID=A0ABW8TC83_9CLOT